MSLLSKNLENLKTASGYKFSATKINDLGSATYTLVTVAIDASGSVSSFATQLENVLETIVLACQKSPQKDTLMFRIVQFSNNIKEIHGFKLLKNINSTDYKNSLQIGGSTALFDSFQEGLDSNLTYSTQLTDQDFLVNSLFIGITDGQDNMSGSTAGTIKKLINDSRTSEKLESLTTILVGVTSENDPTKLDQYLTNVKDNSGLDRYISIGDTSADKMAKLANFISQSISSTSSALGSGKASQPVAFTI